MISESDLDLMMKQFQILNVQMSPYHYALFCPRFLFQTLALTIYLSVSSIASW